MTVNDILILVRQRLGDMNKISFSDPELLICLNNAIYRLSKELADQNDPEMGKTFNVVGQTPTKRPIDFLSLRGQYPLEWTTADDGSATCQHIDPDFTDTMPVRYFARRHEVQHLTDEIPFERPNDRKQLTLYTLYEVKPSMEQQAQQAQTGSTPKQGNN